MKTIKKKKKKILVAKIKSMIRKDWLLRFNTTLIAKVRSWQSVMHMYFLAFSHQYQHKYLSKATDYFSHMLQQR